MIMNKYCSDCYKYPLCEKIEKPTGTCEDWKSNLKEKYLSSKDNYNYIFKDL